jgi:hypothetical protein
MKLINRAVITAAVGLGLAIGASATASAQPIWDLEAYDDCMYEMPDGLSQEGFFTWSRTCCEQSGGQWRGGESDPHRGQCVAPPAEADNVPGNGSPTETGKPRPPLAPGDSVGVADDPIAGTPLPTPTPRPRPPLAPGTSVG